MSAAVATVAERRSRTAYAVLRTLAAVELRRWQQVRRARSLSAAAR